MDSLETLRQVSARLGRNLDLIQAGGGNTSLKLRGELWIKASGKWLINADSEEMFLPVPMPEITAAVERGEEYTTAQNGLRPSVETAMHAVIPQACVVHVHSVNVLAWAALSASPNLFAGRLSGFRWVWIPYIHPGLPLALRIREAISQTPADVIVLQNHGLIVASDSCQSAEALLRDVEQRMQLPMRDSGPADRSALAAMVDEEWQIAADDEVHALGTDRETFEFATSGTMYPDHCVYLGHALATLQPGEQPVHAVERYRARWDKRPSVLACEGTGVLTCVELSRAGREMLICLARVARRIPSDEEVHYLPYDDVARLMNWDAEHYRQAMARQMEQS